MTPQQIKQRLDDEFPNRHVTFCLEIVSYRNGSDSTDDPDLKPIEMSLYDSQYKHFPCASLEEGISALKSKLGLSVPEMEIEV